jgi:arylformamidase
MDQAALDAALNNAEAVADSGAIVARWREKSDALRTAPDVRTDIPYGSPERTKLDYFPGGWANAPLFLFIHGGYWQMREKESFSIFAEGPRAHGINVAMVGYTLAPQARLRQIVSEIRQSIDFLAGNSESLGFDASRIYVGGWSAGGHLTATTLDHPQVCGGLAISGIFDLEPIALSYLNEALQLDVKEIADLSPIRHVGKSLAPVRVVAGGGELPELRRQSAAYAEAARATGMTVSLQEAPGLNHFTMLEELEKPDGILTGELMALITETAD